MQSSNSQACLSIIVPLLNEAEQVSDLLDHLRAWENKGCEIILVDGGSSDGTLATIQASGLKALSAPRGRARQMNAGANAATGDILLFLHADTRLCDGSDALVRDALAREDRCWGRFDVRIDGNHWMLGIIGGMMNLRSRLTGIATGDQCLFVSAKAFRSVEGFPDQPLMEDIELSRRLRRLAPPACLWQQVTTSGRRWLDKGIWSTVWLMWRLRWAYWRGTTAEHLAGQYQ